MDSVKALEEKYSATDQGSLRFFMRELEAKARTELDERDLTMEDPDTEIDQAATEDLHSSREVLSGGLAAIADDLAQLLAAADPGRRR